MNKKVLIALTASAFFSTSAFAAASIDARVAGGTYEEKFDGDSLEVENAGFEFRARIEATPEFSIRGQLNRLKGDEIDAEGDTFDVDTTVSTFRVGGAYDFTSVGTNALFFGSAEYASVKIKASEIDVSESDSGVILSLGFRDAGKSSFLWSAELGAVALKDNKGATLDVTLGYRFSPNWALVGGVQSYAVENEDDDIETTLGIGTLGIRGSF